VTIAKYARKTHTGNVQPARSLTRTRDMRPMKFQARFEARAAKRSPRGRREGRVINYGAGGAANYTSLGDF